MKQLGKASASLWEIGQGLPGAGAGMASYSKWAGGFSQAMGML